MAGSNPSSFLKSRFVILFSIAASLEFAREERGQEKKPASVAAGVLSFESEIKSGQHPARNCGAMVVMMPDCAGCCSCGHEKPV
jgi:hypothetical protein